MPTATCSIVGTTGGLSSFLRTDRHLSETIIERNNSAVHLCGHKSSPWWYRVESATNKSFAHCNAVRATHAFDYALVADVRKPEVEDDAVVDGQSHQHADEVVLPQRAGVRGGEPVAAGVGVVDEHAVLGLPLDAGLEPGTHAVACTQGHGGAAGPDCTSTGWVWTGQ